VVLPVIGFHHPRSLLIRTLIPGFEIVSQIRDPITQPSGDVSKKAGRGCQGGHPDITHAWLLVIWGHEEQGHSSSWPAGQVPWLDLGTDREAASVMSPYRGQGAVD
jgi:hypothetical protein